MIEWIESGLQVEVAPAEYNRLLGYPREWTLEGRARELADWARCWYAAHGKPLMYAHTAENLRIDGDSVSIEGTGFTSPRLAKLLRDSEAHSAVVAAVSAGFELEEEAQNLWRVEKPDEYFFLETFGSAVVERLIAMTGGRLCDWAQDRELAVLPHYSPGYPDWDIGDQTRLLELISSQFATGIQVLDSGALRPKKSLLAVFGLTRRREGVPSLKQAVPCQTCTLDACQFRRQPQNGRSLEYVTNRKALKRWAAERLSIERNEQRSIHARFRYDGTTCTNMGRPLAFEYHVTLGPREEGYPIQDERCCPVAGDEGYRFMCQFLRDAKGLMDAIDSEKPLLGQPLSNVLSWERPEGSTGCYCDAAAREHKWGLVLETIHYALH